MAFTCTKFIYVANQMQIDFVLVNNVWGHFYNFFFPRVTNWKRLKRPELWETDHKKPHP